MGGAAKKLDGADCGVVRTRKRSCRPRSTNKLQTDRLAERPSNAANVAFSCQGSRRGVVGPDPLILRSWYLRQKVQGPTLLALTSHARVMDLPPRHHGRPHRLPILVRVLELECRATFAKVVRAHTRVQTTAQASSVQDTGRLN
jgi:hypothetical protein